MPADRDPSRPLCAAAIMRNTARSWFSVFSQVARDVEPPNRGRMIAIPQAGGGIIAIAARPDLFKRLA